MGMRLLTQKFTAYNIAKFENKHNKEFIDFIDIGKLSIGKMLTLIAMGNNNCSEEEAGKKLDNFLDGEDNSLIDAYIQLIDEIDRDTKLLKKSGIKVEDLKKQFEDNISKSVEEAKEAVEQEEIQSTVIETALLEGENPKVDINGNVSLD